MLDSEILLPRHRDDEGPASRSGRRPGSRRTPRFRRCSTRRSQTCTAAMSWCPVGLNRNSRRVRQLKLAWPDPQTHPEGFISPEAGRPTVLESGAVIDRFGSDFGRFASPPDTPYPDRGLPPENIEAGYHQYRVMRPIPVWDVTLHQQWGSSVAGPILSTRGHH